MKTLLIVIMMCGQPDIVVVKEPGQDTLYGYYEDIIQSPEAAEYLQYILTQPHEEVQIQDDRGLCV